jgi:hypothetical protein
VRAGHAIRPRIPPDALICEAAAACAVLWARPPHLLGHDEADQHALCVGLLHGVVRILRRYHVTMTRRARHASGTATQ